MPENIFPGVSLSILRQATSIQAGQPLLMSGRFTAFGFGIPAFIRVYVEGPSYDPQVRSFDTFSSPFSGDYSVNVLAEKDGQYQVYAQAFPPPLFPVGPPFPEAIPLGPPLAESPRPPIVVGRPTPEGVEALLPTGEWQRYTAPPMTPIETIITVPIAIAVPGVPAPPVVGYPPPTPPPPAPPGVPPPAPPPAPPAVLEATIDDIRFTPDSIVPGQVATGLITWRNIGANLATFDISVYLVNITGTRYGPLQVTRMSAAPHIPMATALHLPTEGLPGGIYAANGMISDPTTGETIATATLPSRLDLAIVEVPVPAPPVPAPPVPPVPAPPVPPPPGAPTVSGLGATFTPSEVQIGDVARGTLTWVPYDTQPFTFGIEAYLVDSAGYAALAARANPTASMGYMQSTTLQAGTTGFAEGWCNLLVIFTDLATGAEIFRGTLPSVLHLLPPPPLAPPPLAPPAPPALPTPDMLGTPVVSLPTQVTQGDVWSGSVVLPTSAPAPYQFNLLLFIVDRGAYRMIDYTGFMTVQPGQSLTLPIDFDTSPLSPGSYPVLVLVTDAAGNTLLETTLPWVLTLLEAPAPPPVPAPPPPVPAPPPPVPAPPALPTPEMVAIYDFYLPSAVTRGEVWSGAVVVATSTPAPYLMNFYVLLRHGILEWVVGQRTRTVELGEQRTAIEVNFRDTDLLGYDSYDIVVRVTDAAGNTLLDTVVGTLTVLGVPAAPPPAPPAPPVAEGAIDAVSHAAGIYVGGMLRVSVAWHANVPAYVALGLYEPPDYVSYRSSTATPVRAAGSYSEDMGLLVQSDNVLGENRLSIDLVSETGVVLDTRERPVTVSPAAPY